MRRDSVQGNLKSHRHRRPPLLDSRTCEVLIDRKVASRSRPNVRQKGNHFPQWSIARAGPS